jgi:hypothetical protein
VDRTHRKRATLATKVGDAALRIRVQRLLRGELKVDDLTALFLALRDRAGGRQSVVDVGAFVAHRNERNKGYVTEAVRDFFVRIRFVIEARERRLTAYDLPSYTSEFLQASARHMDYRAAKGGSRFTRVSVTKALPRLLSHIRKSDGRCFLWPSASQEDLELFDFLTATHTFKPLFTEESLFRDLCGALLENGLLLRTEILALLPMSGAVALFALSHMHQCIVDLGDGIKGRLDASPFGGGSDKIAVIATVPAMDSKRVSMAHAIFLTDRTAAADCVTGMTAASPNPVWPYPVELGSDKKMRPLGS